MSEIKEWCAFCEEEKALHKTDHFEAFRYENKLILNLSVSGVNGFVCEDCYKAIFRSIKESKVLWKENVLSLKGMNHE